MKKSKFVATIMTAAMVCGMLPGLVSQADDTPRIDITIEPGFLSEAFEAEDDYYYFTDRENYPGYFNTTDDVDANITVTAGGDVIPCNMIYFFNRRLDGDQKFCVRFVPDNVNYYGYGESLIVTVNGVQLPLYSEPYEYHMSYYYQNSDDCSVYIGSTGEFWIDFCSTLLDGIDMYRLYNPNSGEHFYTSDAGEREFLISLGWEDEGIGWHAPSISDTPVYRLYNSIGGEHHYTTSLGERNALISAGWTDEGIGWYSDDYHLIPLYRQYNPNEFSNNHNYTTSVGENEFLVSIGWQAEGIGWYGVG